MLDRLASLFVAVCLALLVWIYARTRDQEILDNVALPVEVSLAPGQEGQFGLELTGKPQVLVAFSGPPDRIRELRGVLQRNEMKVSLTVSIPEERRQVSRYLETLRVEASDIPVPPGVKAIIIEGRNRVSVVLHRLIERRLPVRFESLSGEPTSPVVVEPPTVMVRGPQEILEKAVALPTVPSLLPTESGATGMTPKAVSVGLVDELEGKRIHSTPGRVRVRVAQSRKQYELVDVPVHFLTPSGFPFRPKFINDRTGQITLKIDGPTREAPPKVYAFVDLTRGRFGAGLNHEPLQVQLPKDFGLEQRSPRIIAFELSPIETTSTSRKQ